MRKLLLLLFLSSTVLADNLLATPETLTIQGKACTLNANAWRDMMPSMPKRPPPVTISVALAGVSAKRIVWERLWVFESGKQVWEGKLVDNGNGAANASPGPGVGGKLEVVAQFKTADGHTYRLRKSGLAVGRVD